LHFLTSSFSLKKHKRFLMKKILTIFLVGICFSSCKTKNTYYLSPDTPLYKAHELTKDNLFSHNIEGPAFRNDTLFVVNYQEDGTVGMVFPGGRCEQYVRLPE